MADAAAGQAGDRLAIRTGRAFDGRAVIAGGALVLCAGGKIVGVEPGTAPVPEGWPAAEYPGATVLPGLIDCHVHLWQIPAPAPWTVCRATATSGSARSSRQRCERS